MIEIYLIKSWRFCSRQIDNAPCSRHLALADPIPTNNLASSPARHFTFHFKTKFPASLLVTAIALVMSRSQFESNIYQEFCCMLYFSCYYILDYYMPWKKGGDCTMTGTIQPNTNFTELINHSYKIRLETSSNIIFFFSP